MNLRQLYNDAILEQQNSLILLIDFLVFDKKVLNFKSHISELDLYFKPNNKKRMNMFLQEYKESRKEGSA